MAARPEAKTTLRLGDVVARLDVYNHREIVPWIVRAGQRERAGRLEVGIWNERLGWRVAPVKRLVLLRPSQ